jgi:hypothetical protein
MPHDGDKAVGSARKKSLDQSEIVCRASQAVDVPQQAGVLRRMNADSFDNRPHCRRKTGGEFLDDLGVQGTATHVLHVGDGGYNTAGRILIFVFNCCAIAAGTSSKSGMIVHVCAPRIKAAVQCLWRKAQNSSCFVSV